MLPQHTKPTRPHGWVAALALAAGCSAIAIATAQQLPLSQDEARNLARSRDLDSLRRANTAKTATGQPLLLNPGKVPLPSNLKNYLNPSIGFAEARLAAAQLGKALFWDQAIGSDGQA